jgi:hypothetical protein
MMFRFAKAVTGHLFGTMLLAGHVSLAVAAHARLSVAEVQALADAAAPSASYDQSSFVHFGLPHFDPVTRVWVVDFAGKEPKDDHRKRFRVFVYDATSRTEVTCLGMTEPGGTMGTAALPSEVQSFVANGEAATELYCADLNGDGLPDYLLVTQDQSQSKRTIQILLRKPNGQLTSAVSNANVVQPPFEDGVNGQHNIIARHNKFSVVNESAGSGGGVDHVFYFEYSKPAGTWILTRAERELTGNAHAEYERGGTWVQKDFGRIEFSEFDRRRFD